MRFLLFFIFVFSSITHAKEINAQRVGVIYNSTVPESRELAEAYARARNIPATNLIPLSPPDKGTITREEYNTHIRDPLRKHFSVKGWWKLQKQADGVTLPVQKNIDVLVTTRGIPFRISRKALAEGEPVPKQQFGKANEAAVDSELVMMGVSTLPIGGYLQNKFFESKTSFAEANLPYLFLVGRLDGPSWEDCHRLYQDAIETEKTGLWGMCYLDLSGRNPEGDKWINNIGIRNKLLGIPYVIDTHKLCYPAKYPMSDAALYYGWYAQERNGPLLNPDFRFKKGAIAMHLHSFSGTQLRQSNKKWSGPIIAAGAAGTIGNVYEPYLGLTHRFDILHAALLKGHTLVEAAHMSIAALSWQGMVIGDPLYRPFLHFENITGELSEADRPYRLLRAAAGEWIDEPAKYTEKLSAAATQMKSGIVFESLGLREARLKNYAEAQKYYISAINNFSKDRASQLRNNLHIIEMARTAKLTDQAVSRLKDLKKAYNDLPEIAAVDSLITQLNPPAPKPTPPGKKPAKK